jgi:hypothetical protein
MAGETPVDVFQTLKARRQEEEHSLDFLDKNRRILQGKCQGKIDLFYNENLGNYIYKRLRRPAASEIELKTKFKKSFAFKQQFTENRTARNSEYVLQRKRDFAISQERAKALTKKLQDEYKSNVTEHLRRHANWVSRTRTDTSSLVDESTSGVANRICEAAVQLATISDALSFVPAFYLTIVKHFHRANIPFSTDASLIPTFWVNEYRRPLRAETQRLLITLSEGCLEGSMIPAVPGRKTRSVCILLKPLVFSPDVCTDLADSVGCRAIFGSDFHDSIPSLFSVLCESTEDVLVFGFPRHPAELSALSNLFNREPKDDGFLSHPQASAVQPFDIILELDIADEIVLGDVLAELEDSEDGTCYDVRTLAIDTEEQLVRLKYKTDPNFDVEQYASRSVTLKSNFDLIAEANRPLYRRLKLDSRVLSEEVIDRIKDAIDSVADPTWPSYPPTAVYPTLLANLRVLSLELKEFSIVQWRSIEENYAEAIRRAFDLMNETFRLMITHLKRSRRDMKLFLGRPGSSQHLVIEFQQWHCGQVERCMRRMQRVKDECNLRLNALREQLLQIENDRKTEEETKQKDLANAAFRTTLFEFVNNACTLLAHAEIDRWAATHSLMVDFNQIVSEVALVPQLPHKT